MNHDFENVVIQNKIDALTNELKFGLEVLGVPYKLADLDYDEYIAKMLNYDLHKWQWDLLLDKANMIIKLMEMINGTN